MLAVLGFELLRPAWAFALLAGPLLAVTALWALARRRRERERLVAPRHLARLVPGWSIARARWRGMLAAAGALFLGLALIGPVRGYTVREVERRGLDLVIAFDTSRSMLAQDLRPDRLTRAKREVRGLLQKMGGDRAAVLAFAGDVRLVAPLTHDRDTLALFVESLNPGDNLVGGTNLGGAIERALELFDGRTGSHEAVVLVTDGEDHEAQGLRAAELAAERGIRIFVVGVGTESGGKLADRHQGFVRDAAGQEVITRLDATTLRAIAEASGGAYLAVGEAAFPLERLYSEHMSRLETRALWSGKLRVPHDRFQWAMVPALVCMLLAAGMRERVPGSVRAVAVLVPGHLAPARGAAHVAVLGLVGVLGLSLQVPAPEEPTPLVRPSGSFVDELEQVQRLARAGEVDAALTHAEALLAPTEFARWRAELDDEGLAARAVDSVDGAWELLGWNGWPREARAEVHHARGTALLEAERREESEAAFQTARALFPGGELSQDATYDLGVAALLEGEVWRAQIPELGGQAPTAASPDEEPPDPLEIARGHYERARAALVERLRLDWRDADTRANTELVQRRLRELDEIERAREEQEPPPEEQGEDSEDSEDSEPSDEPSEDSESQDGSEDEQEPEEGSENQPEPGEDESPSDEEAPPEPSEEEGEEREPEETGDAESEGEENAAEQELPAEEPLLTREEIQRLLDRLQRIEEEAAAQREALRSRRRVPVEKDW